MVKLIISITSLWTQVVKAKSHQRRRPCPYLKNSYNTNNHDVFWFCVNYFLCMVSLYPAKRCDARVPCNCLYYTNIRLIWYEGEPNLLSPLLFQPQSNLKNWVLSVSEKCCILKAWYVKHTPINKMSSLAQFALFRVSFFIFFAKTDVLQQLHLLWTENSEQDQKWSSRSLKLKLLQNDRE